MSQNISVGSRKEAASVSLITRACDMCRKKKIRCDPTAEACAQCGKYKTRCHFTPITVKRRPRRPVGDKRVEELEKRLQLMEEQLQRALQNQQPNKNTEPEYRELGTARSQTEISGSIEEIYGDEPALTPRGSSTWPDYELPSPKNIFDGAPRNEISSPLLDIIHYNDSLTRRAAFQVLPPKDRALSIMEKTFQNFNAAFPLFDRASFMHRYETSEANRHDISWWACVNVVLALSQMFQHAPPENGEDFEAWGYFQNAFAVSNELLTIDSTLSSVQALLGMSIVMQGTSNKNAAALLAASAIKAAQRMGLHRRNQDPRLSAAVREERKRVFWIAYFLDKEFSLQTGQPPTQDEDDMDLELPLPIAARPSEPHAPDFFNLRARLAMIQGAIYKRLCSVKASKQSTSERVLAVKELEAMLRDWKASTPFNFQQDYTGHYLQLSPSELVENPVGLRLSYYNCLATVYGSLSALPKYIDIHGLEVPVGVHITSPPKDYVAESRRAITLLSFTPKRSYACVWAVLHIFVSATTTLLTHTLANPTNPSAQADLKLIEPLLALLCLLAKSGNSNYVGGMYQSCTELFERAKQAVESYKPATKSLEWRGTNENPGGRESIEDFLMRIESISSGHDDVEITTISGGLGEGGFTMGESWKFC